MTPGKKIYGDFSTAKSSLKRKYEIRQNYRPLGHITQFIPVLDPDPEPDPDSVGSEIFCRIRIWILKNSFQIQIIPVLR
jgi:hypothetical protein